MNSTYYRFELLREFRDRIGLFFATALPASMDVVYGATQSYAEQDVGRGNIAAHPVALIYTTDAATGARAEARVWLPSALLTLLGAVAFSRYGLCFGRGLRSRSAAGAASGSLVILAFLGSLFMPLSGAMLTLARLTPPYGVTLLARRPLTDGRELVDGHLPPGRRAAEGLAQAVHHQGQHRRRVLGEHPSIQLRAPARHNVRPCRTAPQRTTRRRPPPTACRSAGQPSSPRAESSPQPSRVGNKMPSIGVDRYMGRITGPRRATPPGD